MISTDESGTVADCLCNYGEPVTNEGFVVGVIYEDCAYHPVLCTQVFSDGSIGGISLLDGSEPRVCDPKHCGPELLTLEQAILIKRHPTAFAEHRGRGVSVAEALAPYVE